MQFIVGRDPLYISIIWNISRISNQQPGSKQELYQHPAHCRTPGKDTCLSPTESVIIHMTWIFQGRLPPLRDAFRPHPHPGKYRDLPGSPGQSGCWKFSRNMTRRSFGEILNMKIFRLIWLYTIPMIWHWADGHWLEPSGCWDKSGGFEVLETHQSHRQKSNSKQPSRLWPTDPSRSCLLSASNALDRVKEWKNWPL